MATLFRNLQNRLLACKKCDTFQTMVQSGFPYSLTTYTIVSASLCANLVRTEQLCVFKPWNIRQYIAILFEICGILICQYILTFTAVPLCVKTEDALLLYQYNWVDGLIVTEAILRLIICCFGTNVVYQIYLCLNLQFRNNLIRLFRIISIPSKFCYFRPPDHVISMD